MRDLLNAADSGNIEDVRNLVEVVGVPANIRAGMALILAARNGHLDIVSYLVKEEEGLSLGRVSNPKKNET